MITNLYDPQSWDRYSYVNNNPLRYTDPTGHQLCGDGENVNCSGGLSNPTGNAGNCSGSDCQGTSGSSGSTGGNGGTPSPSSTPPIISAPTVPASTVPPLITITTTMSGTPNPYATNFPIVSTQTPLAPAGWTPPPPFDYGIGTLIDLCGGASPAGSSTCDQIVNGVGQALPAIGIAAAEPGPFAEIGFGGAYAINYTCQNFVDCSIHPDPHYTPNPVTVTPSATMPLPTPSTTPTFLPYITPTYITPSSTFTYWPTPTP
jgi:hypothetical protein